MKRIAIILLMISVVILSACSKQQSDVSLVESITSAGIDLTETKSPAESELDGILPLSYQLDNEEVIRIFEFDSTDQRELGQEHFTKNQQILSSHAPIIYQTHQYLVLYYSNVDTLTQTPGLSESTYGIQIDNVIKKIQ
ncbi:hypothetical protein PMSD_09615 [Paenibacillus macquariensis subsp. defensor]|nr:hypothetical protein PMSD_09615 [Paenibacillus macquariensis subsp. defensor]